MRTHKFPVIAILVILLTLLTTLPAYSLLVIDPGHGGTDSGATASLNGSLVYEKNLNLSIGRLVHEKLSKLGFETTLTRNGDLTVSLSDRVNKANSLPTDFFISIHHNSALTASACGVEAFYYQGNETGRLLAELITKKISETCGLKNRGAKETTTLYVIRSTKATAVLVECGFMSNPEELLKLVDGSFQNRLAEAIVSAILDFVVDYFNKSGAVERIFGLNRYETSVLLSSKFVTTAGAVVLANGFSEADMLSASSLCGALASPLLLIKEEEIPDKVYREIQRLSAKKAYVIGGQAVVSDRVISELKKNGIETTRIGGRDRYETASKIALEVLKFKPVSSVFIVNGQAMADAATASNISSINQVPLLFVKENSIPFFTLKALQVLKSQNPELKVYAVGGPTVVSEEVAQVLGVEKRLSGNDRFQTNIAVQDFAIKELGLSTGTAFFLNGYNLADSFPLGSLGVFHKAPLFLCQKDCLPSSLKNYLNGSSFKIQKHLIVGGTSIVSDLLLKDLSIVWLNK